MRGFLPILVALALTGLLSMVAGSPTTATGAGDPVIAAAGDIACDPAGHSYNGGRGTATACRQKYTSDLLANGGFAAVLPLGDNQYYCGSLRAYERVFAPTWGRVKAIMHPTTGNHEYLTRSGRAGTGCSSTNANAAGYFRYFGSAAGGMGRGYYSFKVGGWHLIALNSQCSHVGGCGPTSQQGRWLAANLAAHRHTCTLAYWHIPLFSSGGRAKQNSLPFWKLLYAAHADVVLNGHDHIYERFAPQGPSGRRDRENGIREFIVGTGGADHTSVVRVAANSQVWNDTTYGVLELTLHQRSYKWKFLPATGSGGFSDSGSARCHEMETLQKSCIVPRVKGKKLRAAERAIRREHCSVGKVRWAYSRRIRKKRVIAQRPRAGAWRAPGAKVRLTVSKGRKKQALQARTMRNRSFR